MSATSPIERVAALPEDVRTEVLTVLDELTRPLGQREIEKALAPILTRQQRMPIVAALMNRFTLVAIVEGHPAAKFG